MRVSTTGYAPAKKRCAFCDPISGRCRSLCVQRQAVVATPLKVPRPSFSEQIRARDARKPPIGALTSNVNEGRTGRIVY